MQLVLNAPVSSDSPSQELWVGSVTRDVVMTIERDGVGGADAFDQHRRIEVGPGGFHPRRELAKRDRAHVAVLDATVGLVVRGEVLGFPSKPKTWDGHGRV